MEDIKKLFKRMAITSFIFLAIGIVSANKYMAIGLTSGSIISILSLYILSLDAKSIAYCNDHKLARKIAIFGYLKRYMLYMSYLSIILYFFGFKYFIFSVIGLLSIRFNIYFILMENKLKNLKNK